MQTTGVDTKKDSLQYRERNPHRALASFQSGSYLRTSLQDYRFLTACAESFSQRFLQVQQRAKLHERLPDLGGIQTGEVNSLLLLLVIYAD